METLELSPPVDAAELQHIYEELSPRSAQLFEDELCDAILQDCFETVSLFEYACENCSEADTPMPFLLGDTTEDGPTQIVSAIPVLV